MSANVIRNPRPQYVTSLPASPHDGQEVYFAADAANGVMWHLRYRSAASGLYKWEFLGGSQLSALIDASESVASGAATTPAAAVDLTTVGPSITAPLAGDYEVTHGAFMYGSAAEVQPNAGVSINNGACTLNAYNRMSAATRLATISRSGRVTVATASHAIKQRYWSGNSAGTLTYGERYLLVRPVRVG